MQNSNAPSSGKAILSPSSSNRLPSYPYSDSFSDLSPRFEYHSDASHFSENHSDLCASPTKIPKSQMPNDRMANNKQNDIVVNINQEEYSPGSNRSQECEHDHSQSSDSAFESGMSVIQLRSHFNQLSTSNTAREGARAANGSDSCQTTLSPASSVEFDNSSTCAISQSVSTISVQSTTLLAE